MQQQDVDQRFFNEKRPVAREDAKNNAKETNNLQQQDNQAQQEQTSKGLFEFCISNASANKQSNLIDLCDEYVKHQIKRLDITTNIQTYYLDIRKQQIERSQEIKVVVFTMIIIALVIAAIQIGFGIMGKSGQKESEIEISINKLRLTSSISGLILLVISFLFFYLYIANVYTITQ